MVKRSCKNLEGQKFGRWVVLENRGPHGGNNCIYWLCRCDCGTERETRGSLLIHGQSKSCGCLAADNLKGKPVSVTLPTGHAARNIVRAQYKRAAQKCGRSWNISRELFDILVSSNCTYCGIPPRQLLKARRMNGDFIYNGIDRVDNSVGYEPDNVVPCCIVCNRAKGKLTTEQFVNWIKRLAARGY